MSASPAPLLPFLALALSLPAAAPAKEGASGSFQIDDQTYAVADAIAWRDDDRLKIVFSDKPYDRAAFAEDGELDAFDFMRHDGATLELSVDPEDGSLSGVGTMAGGTSRFFSGHGETLTVERRDEAGIAGTFALGDAPGIQFDLPITPTKIERPGEPLPADGGEPGKALLAQFAAIHAGDLDALMAMAPPEQAAEMQAAKDSGEAAQMMAMAKLFTPTDVKISGGHQDGDKAWVDFTGTETGGKVTGTAMLTRSGGRWRVESTSSSQSSE